MPVGLAPSGPDGTGLADCILLGSPGLRCAGPYTAGIQPGWLVLLAVANTVRRAVRCWRRRGPAGFAFPGRQVHAAQISPQPDARTMTRPARAPAILLPAPGGPAAPRRPPGARRRAPPAPRRRLRHHRPPQRDARAAHPAGTPGRRASLWKDHHRAEPRQRPPGAALTSRWTATRTTARDQRASLSLGRSPSPPSAGR